MARNKEKVARLQCELGGDYVDTCAEQMALDIYNTLINSLKLENLTFNDLSRLTAISYGPFREMVHSCEGKRDIVNVGIINIIKSALVLKIDLAGLFLNDKNRYSFIRDQFSKLTECEKKKIIASLSNENGENDDETVDVSGKYYSTRFFCDLFWDKNSYTYAKSKSILNDFISIDEKYVKFLEIINETRIFYTAHEELIEIKYQVESVLLVYFFDGTAYGKKYISLYHLFDSLIYKYQREKQNEKDKINE